MRYHDAGRITTEPPFFETLVESHGTLGQDYQEHEIDGARPQTRSPSGSRRESSGEGEAARSRPEARFERHGFRTQDQQG